MKWGKGIPYPSSQLDQNPFPSGSQAIQVLAQSPCLPPLWGEFQQVLRAWPCNVKRKKGEGWCPVGGWTQKFSMENTICRCTIWIGSVSCGSGRATLLVLLPLDWLSSSYCALQMLSSCSPLCCALLGTPKKGREVRLLGLQALKIEKVQPF